RVEPEVGDPEGDRAAPVRLRPVPDFGERRPAVVRLVDARLVRARLEPLGLAGRADHVVQAANTERRADEDMARIVRVDHDRVDPAAEEGIDAWGGTRVRPVADTSVVELRPVVAVVGRLIDADTSLAAGRAAVRLTRPEVERVVFPGARDERQRSDRVLVELLGAHLVPVRVRSSRIVGTPDAAARDAGPERALLGRA